LVFICQIPFSLVGPNIFLKTFLPNTINLLLSKYYWKIFHIISHSYMFWLVSMETSSGLAFKRYCVQLTMFCWVQDLVLHFIKFYELS
jgi:hypothetical protein